ncbi:phosphoenolpyruvate-dependent sugar phosphotransferase system, EIIA 2 [Enterococcus faecalis 13-SD-W-01]|nr:phosphoenolpyruvate-dependent sugar phosphotransferase system, EIIA 2 [Enterococcus faecalis 13-SD-W-01]
MDSAVGHKISYLLKLYSGKELTLDQAVQKLNCSIEQAEIELKEFTTQKSENTFFVKSITPVFWTEKFLNLSRYDIVYTEMERKQLIYLLVYANTEKISIFHFQDFLKLSKGTVLAEIKKIRSHLKKEGIELLYTRKTGFTLKGKEFSIRRKAKNAIVQLLESETGKFGLAFWSASVSIDYYAQIRDIISEAAKKMNLNLAPSRMEELAYFLAFSKERINKKELERLKDEKLLSKLSVAKASRFILENWLTEPISKKELSFFSLCLAATVQGDPKDRNLDFLLGCSAEVIYRVEASMAIEFDSFRELLTNLFYHLVPTYFRASYGFQMPNVMIEQIKQQYFSLFELTRKALLPFEKLTGQTLSEDELGFVTILFGGEMRKKQNDPVQKEIRAVIVCPNGVSSSLIVKRELQELFPGIYFAGTNSINQLQEIEKESYDIIFSTIPLKEKFTGKSVYLLRPLMSEKEKNQLIRQVQKEWLVPGFTLPTPQEVLQVLSPYITLKEGVTEEKLYAVLNRKMDRLLEKSEAGRPMLSELLTEEMIQLTERQEDWESAIRLAADPLKKTNKITEEYVQAMIDRVEKYGAFIHIGEYTALPHARPEEGVNQVGMSLLKVDESVNLIDDPKHPIKLFICLAAIDNDAHLRALANLTKLLSNKENLKDLLQATTKKEILAIIQKGDE